MDHEQLAPSEAMIDVSKLFSHLGVTDLDLRSIEELSIPSEVIVTSASAIKTTTVNELLRLLRPHETFHITGLKIPSDVDEQPIGYTTIDGAGNRFKTAQEKCGDTPHMIISIENGLFRARQNTPVVDMFTGFDPDAEYDDRAVAIIGLPNYPTVAEISPAPEAVRFPKAAIQAAHDEVGSFALNTVGSKLAEIGLISDKQNPHSELTQNRFGGPLSRQDQMARVMTRALLKIVLLADRS